MGLCHYIYSCGIVYMLIRSHKNNLYVYSLLQEWTHSLLNNMLDLTAIPNNPLLWWVLRQTCILTSPQLPKIISVILSIGCRQETEELKFHLTTWPAEVMRGCKSKQTEKKSKQWSSISSVFLVDACCQIQLVLFERIINSVKFTSSYIYKISEAIERNIFFL